MGYEFERETFGCRPRQRPTGRCKRPGFQVGQVGGQRSQRVFAYAFLGKVLQRGGILTGQEFGESVAPLHRQDRRQRIELQGSSHFRVGHQRTRGDAIHRPSQKPLGSIRPTQQHRGVTVRQTHALSLEAFSDRRHRDLPNGHGSSGKTSRMAC